MQQIIFHNNFGSLLKFIEDTRKSIEKKVTKFGYRERIQIERCLFLLLKSLCNEKLKYNLQGFSNDHIEELRNYIVNNECDSIFVQTIEKAFQLKVFIVRLSCENAYVRGDSISKLGLNAKTVYKSVEAQLDSISNKAQSLMKYN